MLIPIALTMMLILTRVGGSVVFCPDGSDGRSICNWPDGVLKYEISSSFNREEGKIIRDAVSDLGKTSKLKNFSIRALPLVYPCANFLDTFILLS